jgi:hypothetical protein
VVGIPGLDKSIYPGDNIMQWLLNNTNLRWTGFYLAPAPCRVDRSWMNTYGSLQSMGWGFAPVYLGQQNNNTRCPQANNLTQPQGVTDAIDAATLAAQAGFPSGSVIFLDVEQGGILPSSFITYIRSWIEELTNNQSYSPGIYCSYLAANQIQAAVPSVTIAFWVWRIGIIPCPNASTATYPDPDPSQSSIPYASAWQFAQECDIDAGGTIITVDLDSASTADPSSLRSISQT